MDRLKRIVEKGADVHGNVSKPLYEEMLLKMKKIGDNPQCYVKKLDRKPHLSRCGSFLSIQKSQTNHGF